MKKTLSVLVFALMAASPAFAISDSTMSKVVDQVITVVGAEAPREMVKNNINAYQSLVGSFDVALASGDAETLTNQVSYVKSRVASQTADSTLLKILAYPMQRYLNGIQNDVDNQRFDAAKAKTENVAYWLNQADRIL